MQSIASYMKRMAVFMVISDLAANLEDTWKRTENIPGDHVDNFIKRSQRTIDRILKGPFATQKEADKISEALEEVTGGLVKLNTEKELVPADKVKTKS